MEYPALERIEQLVKSLDGLQQRMADRVDELRGQPVEVSDEAGMLRVVADHGGRIERVEISARAMRLRLGGAERGDHRAGPQGPAGGDRPVAGVDARGARHRRRLTRWTDRGHRLPAALLIRRLAADLAPGENLIEVREAKSPQGSASERSPPKPADPPAGTGAAVGSMGVADIVLGGVDAIDNLGAGGPTDWLVRLLFGRTAHGRSDSIAGGYALAVPRSRPLVVAVTDRRMLVLKLTGSDPLRPLGAPPEPVAPERLTSLWWVRRAQITGARRRRHRLHGARLRVELPRRVVAGADRADAAAARRGRGAADGAGGLTPVPRRAGRAV